MQLKITVKEIKNQYCTSTGTYTPVLSVAVHSYVCPLNFMSKECTLSRKSSITCTVSIIYVTTHNRCHYNIQSQHLQGVLSPILFPCSSKYFMPQKRLNA